MNTFFTSRLLSAYRPTAAGLAALLACLGTFAACEEQTIRRTSSIPRVDAGGSKLSQQADQNPIVDGLSINGRPVHWEDIRPALLEMAGAQAVEDASLDAAVDRLMAQRHLTVSSEQIERERDRLLAAIAEDSGLNQSQADIALARIRGARGLGPVRMEQLLARNAKLRALVAGTFDPTPEERSTAMELASDAKVSVVLVLVKDEQEASRIRAGLLESPGPDIERMKTLARARSIDTSARNDGRIGPISPKDPRVPAALRGVFASLPLGEVSPLVAMDEGFALVMVEARTDALLLTQELQAKVDAALLARNERRAMERLARKLLDEADVRVTDPSLKWSWERRRATTGGE